MAAIGVAVGLVMAVALTRGMASMLFGVAATDLVSFAGATAALVARGSVAVELPRLVRAAAVDPAVTLRAE